MNSKYRSTEILNRSTGSEEISTEPQPENTSYRKTTNRSTDSPISVDRYSQNYQEYQISDYRSTDLPKSVDRFALWANQLKTNIKSHRRVQTIIKIIFSKAKRRQITYQSNSRARTCGTLFRRTDTEKIHFSYKNQNTVFQEPNGSKSTFQVFRP